MRPKRCVPKVTGLRRFHCSTDDIIWIFDQSSNHALNANRMNVGPGGKHTPVMTNTMWECRIFSTTDSSGQNIGLKTCLERRNR